MSTEYFTARGATLYKGHRVVQIVERTDDGKIKFCAQGGGIVQTMLASQFDVMYESYDLDVNAFSSSEVQAEWLPEDLFLPCYTNSQRWNGWEMPNFSLEAALMLSQHMPGLAYDAERDLFSIQTEDNHMDEYPAQAILVEGKPVKVYPIGAGSWCWESVDRPTSVDREKP